MTIKSYNRNFGIIDKKSREVGRGGFINEENNHFDAVVFNTRDNEVFGATWKTKTFATLSQAECWIEKYIADAYWRDAHKYTRIEPISSPVPECPEGINYQSHLAACNCD